MTFLLAAEMADLIIARQNYAICVYDYRQAIITHIAHQPLSPPRIGGTNAPPIIAGANDNLNQSTK